MKRIRKKNQIILTLLAVMIIAAGYLSYLPGNDAADSVPAAGNQDGSAVMDISDEDILAENIAREQSLYTAGQTAEIEVVGESDGEEKQEEDSTVQPGQAVLTWTEQVENIMADAALNKEQTRTRNEETLNSIINNEKLDSAQRKAAADNLLKMTQNAQLESNIESILEGRGLPQTMVTITENGVEVLVGSTEISDKERAQIEDTVKREANVKISDVVISLMNPVNTEVVEEK
ncbi:MAG: SpoIIIAH-like family protein [Lachnospiraceae bacterium]